MRLHLPQSKVGKTMISQRFPVPLPPPGSYPVSNYMGTTYQQSNVARIPWYEMPAYIASACQRGANMNPPISTEEWIKRDRVVFEAYTKQKFKTGDRVVPTHPKEYGKHGVCMITGISSSYRDLEGDKWNADEQNPMIIHAQTMPSEGQPYRFICTPAYLTINLKLHEEVDDVPFA
jgi:hypothetical protein